MTERESLLAEVDTRVRIAEKQGWAHRSVPVRLLRQIATELRAGTVQPQEHAKATSVGAASQIDLSATEEAAFKAGWDAPRWDRDNNPLPGGVEAAFVAYRQQQKGTK